jgi:hypothetical protein
MRNWDNEIDGVARRLTDGVPDANFKARILRRIETVEARRGRRRVLWTAPAIAVATAAAVIFVIVRPHRMVDPVQRAPETLDGVRRTAETANHEGTIARPGKGVERRDRSRETDVIAAASRAARFELSPIHVEPLGVDPIESIAAIGVPRLDVAPLEVPVLTVALLDVARGMP